MPDGDHHGSTHRVSRGRLLLPAAGAGLVVACLAALVDGPPEPHTVAHVHRTVREVALAAGRPDAALDAGTIGPWQIAAGTVDPVTGEYGAFHLRSGRMLVSAGRARLVVDPEHDSFSFEMWDVTYTRVPDDPEEKDPAFVHAMDHYVLGPAPYGRDIIQ